MIARLRSGSFYFVPRPASTTSRSESSRMRCSPWPSGDSQRLGRMRNWRSPRRGTQLRFGFNLAVGSRSMFPRLNGGAAPIAEIDTAFAPLASDLPRTSAPLSNGMLAVQLSAVETPLWGTFSGIRTGSLGAGSVGVGVGLGTTTGLGIVSGISMGSEPG